MASKWHPRAMKMWMVVKKAHITLQLIFSFPKWPLARLSQNYNYKKLVGWSETFWKCLPFHSLFLCDCIFTLPQFQTSHVASLLLNSKIHIDPKVPVFIHSVLFSFPFFLLVFSTTQITISFLLFFFPFIDFSFFVLKLSMKVEFNN